MTSEYFEEPKMFLRLLMRSFSWVVGMLTTDVAVFLLIVVADDKRLCRR